MVVVYVKKKLLSPFSFSVASGKAGLLVRRVSKKRKKKIEEEADRRVLG